MDRPERIYEITEHLTPTGCIEVKELAEEPGPQIVARRADTRIVFGPELYESVVALHSDWTVEDARWIVFDIADYLPEEPPNRRQKVVEVMVPDRTSLPVVERYPIKVYEIELSKERRRRGIRTRRVMDITIE